MPELQSLDHITIAVDDIDRTVRWYTTSFVCRVKSQSANYAELEFGNCTIVLSLPSQEAPHLAFVREDAGSFGRLAPSRDGRESIYVSDPAGNLVELVSEQKSK